MSTTAEGIERKKRIRAGHRAATTTMFNQIDPSLAAENKDLPKLAQLKMILEEKIETLKLLDSEILNLTEESEIEEEIVRCDEYKVSIFYGMAKLNKAIEASYSASASSSPFVTPSSSMDTITREHRVKLPKLTMPTFDGNLTMWTSFWDSFDSAIHQNSALTNVDKFNYLHTLLKGSALESIAGLTLSATNYTEAITLLRKHYGNKQAIITRHMDTLMSLEAVTSNNDTKSLHHLYDMLESNIRSLKSLGVESGTYSTLLCPIVISKLPDELRLIIGRKIGEDEWKLEEVLDDLLQEVEARERISSYACSSTKRRSKEPGSAATLLSKSNVVQCCFCNKSHQPENCHSVKVVEDRKQAIKRSGRCFICLKKGHISRECRSRMKCSKCNGKHHTAICSRSEGTEISISNNNTSSAPPTLLNPPTTTSILPTQAPISTSGLNPTANAYKPGTSLFVGAKNAVLLQTATVQIYNPKNPRQLTKARAVFDTGSQQSYITKEKKISLNLDPVSQQEMSVMTFGSQQPITQNYDVVKVGIATNDGENEDLELFSVPVICQPLTSQPIEFCKETYRHLSNLDLADYSEDGDSMEVDLLIGSNYYWKFATGEIYRGEEGPVAIKTRVGWILSGAVAKEDKQKSIFSFLNTHVLKVNTYLQQPEDLDAVLHSFWNLESLGISTPDSSVLEEFTKTIQFKAGRYEVALPWKEGHPPLPSNFDLSKKRLNSLICRLRQDKEVLQDYDNIIKTQLQKGIIEEVDSKNIGIIGQTHYLPHHAVVKKDRETTKVRVVYDASAKSKSSGCSLNDCLHIGPKFEQRILDILLRFRTYPIALTADIEKAFLMVGITEEDRDALRFLWITDFDSETPDFHTYRFTRVVFGVSSSPFLLNATLQHHLSLFTQSNTQLVRRLTKSMYVDDIITGAQNEEEAYELFIDSKEILRKGGFNLRKFSTNSPTLQKKIDEKEGLSVPSRSNSEETYTKTALGQAQLVKPGEQKVLGVRWNKNTDQLCFGLEDIAQQAITLSPTKRNIVSIVGRFYDPIGFFTPVVVKFKILLQDLCEKKMDWDQPLIGELLNKWKKLVTELASSSSVSIPRYLLKGVPAEAYTHTLYGFCDASKRAYAAVIYLEARTPTEKYITFITSKTRVAPLKAQTIPRLELLSALLLARLMNNVSASLKSELNLSQPICFTDSKVSLYWIIGVDRVWKQFVQHRVVEIRKLLPPNCWHHCPGKVNPADFPSRGFTPVEFSAFIATWINGPGWLGEVTSTDQTDQSQVLPMPSECEEELRVKDKTRVTNYLLNTNSSLGLSNIIDCTRFSSIQKLLRVTAYVIKFINFLKKRPNNTTTDLSTQELAKAETLWIKEAQKQLMLESSFQHYKKQFDLFQDQDVVWRCGGRLSNADLPYHTKHPIIIPRNNHLAKLIVRRAHERILHNGVRDTH